MRFSDKDVYREVKGDAEGPLMKVTVFLER